MLCADMMEVEWTDGTGCLHIATALLEDISAVGACLQMERELPVSAEVELRYHGVDMPAKIKYCVYQEIGFYVGIEFREGFQWSEQAFQPDHLLDLSKM